MSEENQHTSEETEEEMNAENHSNEQSKSDTSILNNEMEQPMLEDEEMPTYISVSTPSRREESDINNTKQQDRIPIEEDHSRSPYPSDDQGGGSIYVLSSGEESNHPYNNEDEEDEYADSEDMDEMELENDRENIMLEDEEEDDDDDEDIETEYDPDCFDRASDDFILNNRMKQHHKERSLSLQDLSFTKNNIHSPYNNKKRHSLNIFAQNYTGLQPNPVANKRLSMPLKYQHVESKVKRYIRDIKEQNRKSMEKRVKEQEYIINKDYEENENNDTDPLKLPETNKVIKDYAEKAIKDLQREENNEAVNGHQQAPTVFNLRTLSYEEYMHGTPNSGQKEDTKEQRHKTQEKTSEPETYNDTEMINIQEMENSNTSCALKIENVKSIRVMQDESESLNFAKTNTENMEIMQLKAQLTQKDAQFHNLRNAYQKTLAENIKMKQELDALKKSLAKYENESKVCETKIAAVQTETTVDTTSKPKIIVTTVDTNNKMSTSSVASTISSIDHWADSACSPAISIKPPDVTPILNSDDSMILTDGTPRKLPYPLSRTFITSSRILQTLSNITQGKTKVESPLVRNSKKRTNETSLNHLSNLEYNSPMHASTSKKRKATDMLGASTFVQPFKIPHTAMSSENKDTSATNVVFKYSEEHPNKKAEQSQDTSMNKNNEDSVPLETEAEETNDLDEDVKCFVYRDNENSKNKSFLIQAEEPTKDAMENDKNRIQECGPYLLGNLEVRMSEINGTISIWGKEVNRESPSDNEDDMEVSIKSIEKKTCMCLEKTPQARFNGNSLVCSTNRKQKPPSRLNKSGVSPCRHSMPSNTMKSPFLLDDLNDQRYVGNLFTRRNSVASCRNCDSAQHRKAWSTCKSMSDSQEKLHSCCSNHTEFIDKDYNCGSYHDRQMYDDSPNHSKDKFHVKGVRRNSLRNVFSPELSNHLHENTNTATEMNEVTCKYNNTCRRSLQNTSNSSQHSTKYFNTNRDDTCTCKSSSGSTHKHDCFERPTCSYSHSNEGEEDLLIPSKLSGETPETRQRRLSGKRVRGILMDLLRGCGDCRSPNDNSVNKSSLKQKDSSHITNGSPCSKVSQCPTPEPTCSSSTQCNDRCCHAYARRIESQLEEFRMEMERVRSRSDAILDMLNMLHSVDMN
ncbi:PREDICTED: stress response protein NST1-like isoform X1 [Dufourea novaeangliae]|uniref:stress response protein NST1-like isoform X1 n=2 Tax=Dufourea novaeangliae TaxID=178035 RepID=UPI0007678C9A|nr:PREDICTED: stress response protein NST1-like isoform X1 [Dufourea novaeangliae]XP_015430040.1 PREDICTED: stress response protein NST1-like isoform X1 [Dufourea novaeangliae]